MRIQYRWLVVAALAFFVACGGPRPTPPPPEPPPPVQETPEFTVAVIVTDARTGRPIADAVAVSTCGDAGGHTNGDGYIAWVLPAGSCSFAATHAGYEDGRVEGVTIEANTDVRIALQSLAPFPPEAGRLRVEGKTFRTESGELWQWRGYSWFLGYRRFLHGEDIASDLRWLRANGVNIVRVFGPLPWKETPDYSIEHFNTNRLGEFFDLVGQHGLRVEFVPICYPFQNASAQRAFVQRIYDIAANHWNVLIEVANEPHVNRTDPVAALKGVNRRGVLTSYGLYGSYYDRKAPTIPIVLDYGTIHTSRDSAWHRKARHAQEVQHATGKPWISDEPAKITEPDFDYPGGKNDPARTPAEMVWHGAVTHLWTPGFTLHTEEGKWGRVPKPGMLQHTVASAVLDHVWLKIGPEWQTGGYVGAHLSSSPVDGDGLKIGGSDIWTYSSLHPNKALSVRVALSAPQPIRGWREVARWGPSGSLVQLTR